jgi:PAS domain S-box-containing protein
MSSNPWLTIDAATTPPALTDLDGLKVSDEGFLAAVVETAAQPIWVVDPEGRIRFANPAAIAVLGYDEADELFGRLSHETIHYRHPDGAPHPAAKCPMLLPRTTGETVASDLDWLVRRDGSMLPVSYVSVPIEMPDGRGAVVTFTNAEDRVRGELLRREHEAILAAQRRVATLVARGVPPPDVFAAVAREVGRLLGVDATYMARYELDGTATGVAAWSPAGGQIPVGTRVNLEGESVAGLVLRTGRPARLHGYENASGAAAALGRELGLRSSVGAPIVVDQRLWGVMIASSRGDRRLQGDADSRIAAFTELVATAISNTEARTQVGRLADEQAALRRVATLVAQGVPSSELFGAVTEEVGTLLRVDLAGMIRYETDDTVATVATWAAAGAHPEVPGRWPTEQGDPATLIAKTRGPVRIDDWDGVPGPIAAFIRDEVGISSSVGSPIVVEGRLWGALAVHSEQAGRLPADTESRLENFTELVATAISNIEARADLAASRARIVAATDEERRRVVRDLHDGAQQRLVHTVITLKQAREALHDEEDRGLALVTEALDNAEQATDELRELAHGILPAVLTHGGLRAGVRALASRTPVPVENAVSVGRLPAAVEATAYFVVAEALTNVAKHARAGRAAVTARVEDGTLRVHVRDDGAGGARPDGSGLLGLRDRVAALGGRLQVESPADGGTLVAAAIPLPAGVAELPA